MGLALRLGLRLGLGLGLWLGLGLELTLGLALGCVLEKGLGLRHFVFLNFTSLFNVEVCQKIEKLKCVNCDD